MAFADTEDGYLPTKPSRPKVTLRAEPQIYYFEKQGVPKMAQQLFEIFDGEAVTDSMLTEASQLFSENYGIWGHEATKLVRTARPGESVKTNSFLIY